MRVVPLFETLDDLINAPAVSDTLFQMFPLWNGGCEKSSGWERSSRLRVLRLR
jgi:phosphoenolpyruvate carboxylase